MFIRFLGERLGNRIHPLLVYLFLAYQLVVSALVFLFDSGFFPLAVLIGWILFLLILGAYLLREHQTGKKKEVQFQKKERNRLKRISRLKQLLALDPRFQTECPTCAHYREADGICRINPGPGERRFRFHHADQRSYCLYWKESAEISKGK